MNRYPDKELAEDIVAYNLKQREQAMSLTPKDIRSYWEGGEYQDTEELGVLLAEIERLQAEIERIRGNPEEKDRRIVKEIGRSEKAEAEVDRLREAAGKTVASWSKYIRTGDGFEIHLEHMIALKAALEK